MTPWVAGLKKADGPPVGAPAAAWWNGRTSEEEAGWIGRSAATSCWRANVTRA